MAEEWVRSQSAWLSWVISEDLMPSSGS